MNPPFKFIMAIVGAVVVLLALSTQSKAVNDNAYGIGARQSGTPPIVLYFDNVGSNTAYGEGALQTGTKTGLDDSAFGQNTLYHNSTGQSNTANGDSALYANTTGYANTAIGAFALSANIIGSDNTATGEVALYTNTTGANNTANGQAALFSNTTGKSNTATGHSALYYNTTGQDNTAVGNSALCANTTGTDNSGEGGKALYSNTSGCDNTADGSGALYSNSTGLDNTAVGFGTLYSNKAGFQNTAIGIEALGLTTGDNNTAVGHDAGANLGAGSGDIDIADATTDSASDDIAGESNTIRIGEVKTQTATYIAGIYAENVGATAEYVVIDSSGRLGTKATKITSINPSKLNAALASMEDRNTKLEATVERQEKDLHAALEQINSLTASLKEQASLLQKVSAQVEVMRSAPQVVSNN